MMLSSLLGYFSSLPETAANEWLDGGEIALLISSLVVVVGVAGEHPRFSHRHVFHAIATILVIVGVSGELIADGIVYRASARLQALQEIAVTTATVQASEANERAAVALRDAANLGVSFGNLHDFVNDQEQRNNAVIEELKSNASSLKKAREDALSAAEETKKTLAEMSSLLDKQRELQKQMVSTLAPRTLSPAQKSALVSRLSKFHETPAVVWRAATTSPDSVPLANALMEILTAAKWEMRGVSITSNASAQGVVVGTRIGSSPKISNAADELVMELRSIDIAATRDPNFVDESALRVGMTQNTFSEFPSGILIFVGTK